MAIDIWLLQKHYLSNHPPTLRFYTWSPSAISLGYHQRNYPQEWENLVWNNQKLDLVRRPTGGRAVLHHGDLTYSVITSELSRSRIEAYKQICEFLIQGWNKLGVDLHYGDAGRGYIHNPNCFGTATSADLVMSDGSKLIGSAQLRKDRAILQHGSMRLNPDAELFQKVFGEELFDSVISVKNLNIEKIIKVLVEAASGCFDIKFNLQPLNDIEWEEILRDS
ncbi:MAG: biotin/lipoate A/B protein ligase family protein [Cyanobacteria bacterium P01_A01_bin.84]